MSKKLESKPRTRAARKVTAQIFPVSKSCATYRALAKQIHLRIANGGLTAGTRLPTIRALAKELGLNRNVVQKAFKELRDRGFVVGKQRGGTRVTSTALGHPRASPRASVGARWESRSGDDVEDCSGLIKWDLRPGQASARSVPLGVWRRACREAGRYLPPADYGDPAGELALRERLAEYLGRSRAFSISPDNILVTNGSGAAIALIARTVLRNGDIAAVEDPGYRRAFREFERAGARVLLLPVEFETGHQLDVLQDGKEAPVVVHLTPAHQYPLGVRLSTEKREAVIRWARRNGSLIVENDYDHEFLYDGERLPPLASKAPDCVGLLGTFSKALSPSIRIGFIAGPLQLIERVRAQVRRNREQVSWPLQQTLLWLLRSGAIDTNITRNRRHYLVLRNAIREALLPFKRFLKVWGDESGLHVTLRVAPGWDVQVLDRLLKGAGVWLERVGQSETHGRPMNSLLLGYGHLQLAELQDALQIIAAVLKQIASNAGST